jgi:DNA polymerase-3 subunit delta
MFEAALKAWSAERLMRVMNQLAEAALEVRRQPNLADALAQRVVLSIASAARRKD